MVRIFACESFAPSHLLARLNRQNTEKRVNLLKGIVAEVMGLARDDPAVSFGCVNVLAPCILLLIADRNHIERAFPDIGLRTDGAAALAQQMAEFAMGGLAALARARRGMMGQ
jgi:hypothetical protein